MPVDDNTSQTSTPNRYLSILRYPSALSEIQIFSPQLELLTTQIFIREDLEYTQPNMSNPNSFFVRSYVPAHSVTLVVTFPTTP